MHFRDELKSLRAQSVRDRGQCVLVRQTDSFYFSTMILKTIQLMGSCHASNFQGTVEMKVGQAYN